MAIARIRIRKRENPYVQIDKSTLNDDRISFRAKGLHAYLLSKPDNWIVHVSQLQKVSPREGRDAILSTIKELEKAGYIRRIRLRNDHGKFIGLETIIFETPELAASDGSDMEGLTTNGFSGRGENDHESMSYEDHKNLSPRATRAKPQTDLPDTVQPDTVQPDTANPPLLIKDFTHNSLVVKKEKKEKDVRTRPKSEETNGHSPATTEKPPTPEQQDEALAAVKPLIDKMLGRGVHAMPPAETDAATIARRREEQKQRAREAGLIV